MALQNDPMIYRAGAERFNTQPVVNIYAQTLARKQAREEALDNYEMNRMNRMNEQGVRDIDRPGLDQKVLDMKAFYQAHKDKIRRGGTPEAYNYEKMFRDTLAGVSKSKNATARAEAFNKLRLERQKLGRNTPEDWFQDYTQHEDTPIWDERFQDLDLSKFMGQNQVKYDPKKALDLFKDIKRTPGSPRYEDIPGDKFGRNKFVDESFDTPAKETIAARASDLYDSNDGFATELQADINNPIRRGELEKISVKEFGSAPQSMHDYAAAKALQMLQPTITGKPKYEQDWFKRQQQMQAWKQQNIRLSRALGGGTEGVTLGDYDILGKKYGDKVVEEDINFPVANTGFTESKRIKLVPATEVDVQDKELFKGVRPYNINGRVFYKVRDDGDWEGANGQIISAQGAAKANLDRTAANEVPRGRLDLDESKLKPKTSSYIIKGKKYSEAELLKMGYTIDQIKPYKEK